MKCDAQGNLWVCGPGGVWVYAIKGELIGKVRVPELVGNLTWGGPDWRTLFLTASAFALRDGDQGRPARRSPT
jgi:gluconolactonase